MDSPQASGRSSGGTPGVGHDAERWQDASDGGGTVQALGSRRSPHSRRPRCRRLRVATRAFRCERLNHLLLFRLESRTLEQKSRSSRCAVLVTAPRRQRSAARGGRPAADPSILRRFSTAAVGCAKKTHGVALNNRRLDALFWQPHVTLSGLRTAGTRRVNQAVLLFACTAARTMRPRTLFPCTRRAIIGGEVFGQSVDPPTTR